MQIHGWAEPKYLSQPLALTVSVDGQLIGVPPIRQSGEFHLDLPLAQPVSPGVHTVEVKTSAWYVPHRFWRNGDYRPLAWRVIDIRLRP